MKKCQTQRFLGPACITTSLALVAGLNGGVTESFWISDNEGCDFIDPINWNGPVPDETVTAIFDLVTTGIGPFVCFDFDELSHRAIVRSGHPEFVMFFNGDNGWESYRYDLLSAELASPSLVVAENPGDDASLRSIGGFISTGSTVIGLAAGSIGDVRLGFFSSSDISGNLGLACNDRLVVGDRGEGHLVAEHSSVVISCATAVLGAQPGSFGEIFLAEEGSRLDVDTVLVAGAAGDGVLTIGDQFESATATCGSGIVGGSDSSVGEVSVAGQNSSWSMPGTLTVGNGGHGTITVSNDADMDSGSTVIGQQLDSVGDVTVTGLGSTWTINETLDIGFLGTGNLTICDGAAVFALDTFVTLGTLPDLLQEGGGVGTVRVCGTGSYFFVDGDLHVGFLSQGNLILEDGGTVVSQSAYVSPGSTMQVIDGGTILPGVSVSGDFQGDGLLQTPSLSTSGAFRIGHPVGTLTVDGTVNAGSLEIEIGGADPGSYDVLSCTGAASVDHIDVLVLEGYAPQQGDVFEILTAAKLAGNLDLSLPGLPEPLFWLVNLDAGSLSLLISKPGDVNGDGAVDVQDLLLVLGSWGPCPPDPEPCPGDIDGDGVVGVLDLLILLGNLDAGLSAP